MEDEPARLPAHLRESHSHTHTQMSSDFSTHRSVGHKKRDRLILDIIFTSLPSKCLVEAAVLKALNLIYLIKQYLSINLCEWDYDIISGFHVDPV